MAVQVSVQDSLILHLCILLLSTYYAAFVVTSQGLAQAIVIVVRIGAVVATAQLHGHIFVGVGYSLHAQ
jgi:hypothetical protein